MTDAIPQQRLTNQLITSAGAKRATDVVSWFGAVQAQEYEPARWALGLRLKTAGAESSIEQAISDGQILRTHVMRPTWHFVSRADIRWLVTLTAPRIHRTLSSYTRQLGVDAATLRRGTAIIERALAGGRFLTRPELNQELRRKNIALDGMRMSMLAIYAELELVICSGPRRGKQQTYGLIAERAPDATDLPRDEALAMLAHRFFRSHGPATVKDFSWWSGLTMADARRGLDMNNKARRLDVDGLTYWTIGAPPRGSRDVRVHLLPIYDEYLVAYRDRLAVPHRWSGAEPPAEAVTFQHAIVIDGQIVGTWRMKRGQTSVSIKVIPLRRLTRRERDGVDEALERYGRFSQRAISS